MFENMREMWRQSGRESRVGLAAGVLLILAIVVYSGFTVVRPEYQTLFADLDPQDASTMVAELDKMKVPYRLGPDGTSIQVEKSQVHPLRMKLLGQNATLRGGVGFEIFNNTDFGMTEFAQKINYQRAMQGELTRTIQSLDEVKTARVHLVLPESGLFKKTGQKPKASITLAMKDGRTLAPEQVVGIQRLVAASVPDIEPSAVTIADQRGVTLTRAAGVDGEEALAGRLGIKSDIEAYFTRKLVALFDRAFGPGRVIVSVDVTVNHDQVKVTREDVLPLGTRGGQAVGALARTRTTISGDSSNVAGVQSVADVPSTQGNGSSTSEIEYLNGRRVEQVVSMPGSIKRLSVGVLLPSVTDKARIDEIRQLVASAVGINPSRGDEVAISALDLSSTTPRPVTEVMKPAVEPPAMNPESTSASNAAKLLLHPEWLVAIGAAMLLLIALALLIGRRSQEPARLTAEGREAVLARVQTWLLRDSATGEEVIATSSTRIRP